MIERIVKKLVSISEEQVEMIKKFQKENEISTFSKALREILKEYKKDHYGRG